jgi:hypothetical protein
MPIVDDRRADFEDQNLFFLATLGLVSASRRLERLLAAHGRSPGGAVSLAPDAVENDPLLCAVLGAIALRDRVLFHVGSALGGSPVRRLRRAREAGPRRTPGELLR